MGGTINIDSIPSHEKYSIHFVYKIIDKESWIGGSTWIFTCAAVANGKQLEYNGLISTLVLTLWINSNDGTERKRGSW